MIIGILYEGGLDVGPIFEMVHKIAIESGFNPELIEFKEFRANAQTLPRFRAAATQFGQEDVDVFIVHADTDGQNSRKRELDLLIEESPELVGNMKIIPLFAHPHFEVFFTKEEIALKTIFGLSPTERIPHLCDNPKQTIRQLILEYLDDITKPTKVVYREIAEKLDITLLARRDDDFRVFSEQLAESFTEARD